MESLKDQSKYPYCSNFAQLGSEMKAEHKPEGISTAQVSRILSNKKRKLRPEQFEALYRQVNTIHPISVNAFNELLVLDRNDPEHLEEAESISQSLSALSAAVIDLNQKQEQIMELTSIQVQSMKMLVEILLSKNARSRADRYLT